MNTYTLVILAAGMGSRYGGLKQMDTMSEDGDTIIDFSIYDAIQAGFTKVVFIVRKDFIDQFKEIFDKKLAGKIEVEYVCQEIDKVPAGYPIHPERVKPWGTGHALLMTKGVVKDNFIVINGDDFYSKEAFKSIIDELSKLDKDSHNMCMVGYSLDKTISENGYVSRGQCYVNEKHELTDVVERTHIEKVGDEILRKDSEGNLVTMKKDTIVSMNFWGFTPKFLEALEHDFEDFMKERSAELKSEFFIPTVVSNVIHANKGVVKVLTSDAKWYGVTYAEDKPVVTNAIAKLKEDGVYPKSLWS
ncbi:nucleotide-diphospho-sugar transferase [Wenyingzhuangia fucanilytica]|uniref:Nucleotide-diphospho-sugar transferase n=1 Tax=Wenyingzhuangia fucanilytica TaxID=1790137 RepID=A0A1B1Y6W3_9FLAO|nr:sugar phosphate nucleotidyltransferase [Wenyingzhuangia fucanilytica]ANW96510.1 nucleotide-diphospho-sugar transferase [Wenyingzhuangia fucanilytica]